MGFFRQPVRLRLFATGLVALGCAVVAAALPGLAGAQSISALPSLVARDDLPLYGKTILFTAPRNYAGRLGGILIEHGARPIWMPTIVIEPLADYSIFDRALRERAKYSWIAFTSRNGIEAFFNRAKALGLEPEDFAQLKFAAIGNDARALEQGGIKPDLVPAVSSPQGMVDELEKRGERGTVMVPVPDVVGMDEPLVVPEFIAALEAAGLQTLRIPAYTTARATEGLATGTQMLLDGEIDMLALTSRGEIESLLLSLGERRGVLDGDVVVACFGPITAAGVKLRNIRVDVVSKDYSRFEGFVEAMEDYFRSQGP